MRFSLIALFFCCFLSLNAKEATKEINFAIVIPSYNNARWCDKCIESVAMQKNKNWHMYYLNDASSDDTFERTNQCIQRLGIQDKCTVINNPVRRYSLANLYDTIHSLDPHVVVVDLDGDDWLENPDVLDTLKKAYSDSNVWMTYGNYRIAGHKPRDPDKSICKEFPEDVMKNRTFRKFKWVTHHLRTFYAKLFQLVKKKDLLWDGQFFKVNGDVGFMHPMLEMASKGHIRRIRDILYVYNVSNPINAYKVNGYLQYQTGVYIRALPPYPALDTLF